MNRDLVLEWVLRIGVFGIFMGHGVWALTNKQGWHKYFTALGIPEANVHALLLLIGLMDIAVALIVLWRPYKVVLGWAVIWAFITAAIRPVTAVDPLFVGLFTVELMDLVERFGNFLMPFALLVWRGFPKKWKDWFGY